MFTYNSIMIYTYLGLILPYMYGSNIIIVKHYNNFDPFKIKTDETTASHQHFNYRMAQNFDGGNF